MQVIIIITCKYIKKIALQSMDYKKILKFY